MPYVEGDLKCCLHSTVLRLFKIAILGKFLDVHYFGFPILQKDLKTNLTTNFGLNLRCATFCPTSQNWFFSIFSVKTQCA